MAKAAVKPAPPVQTAAPIDVPTDTIRAAFEAGLRVGQRVHLRYAFSETNHVSGEKWYAAPGTRGIIDLIEPCPAGKLFWVAFPARYTVDGEEKKRRACKAIAPADLCATKEEAESA